MVHQKGAKRVPPDKGDFQDMKTSPYQALEVASLEEASSSEAHPCWEVLSCFMAGLSFTIGTRFGM